MADHFIQDFFVKKKITDKDLQEKMKPNLHKLYTYIKDDINLQGLFLQCFDVKEEKIVGVMYKLEIKEEKNWFDLVSIMKKVYGVPYKDEDDKAKKTIIFSID